jgi:hypothetical protein
MPNSKIDWKLVSKHLNHSKTPRECQSKSRELRTTTIVNTLHWVTDEVYESHLALMTHVPS